MNVAKITQMFQVLHQLTWISSSDQKFLILPCVEQIRIVTVLDKFDALINDISVGLPAEIKMRRQQYEYYRNQLLTFKDIAQ
jgi:type I restriction enzyme S subunit